MVSWIGKPLKIIQKMMRTRHEDKMADIAKTNKNKNYGFLMFLMCPQCVVAPNFHQKSITTRCQNRWQNRLSLGSILEPMFMDFRANLASKSMQNQWKIDSNINPKKWYVFAWIAVASWVGFGGQVGSNIHQKTIMDRRLCLTYCDRVFLGVVTLSLRTAN